MVGNRICRNCHSMVESSHVKICQCGSTLPVGKRKLKTQEKIDFYDTNPKRHCIPKYMSYGPLEVELSRLARYGIDAICILVQPGKLAPTRLFAHSAVSKEVIENHGPFIKKFIRQKTKRTRQAQSAQAALEASKLLISSSIKDGKDCFDQFLDRFSSRADSDKSDSDSDLFESQVINIKRISAATAMTTQTALASTQSPSGFGNQPISASIMLPTHLEDPLSTSVGGDGNETQDMVSVENNHELFTLDTAIEIDSTDSSIKPQSIAQSKLIDVDNISNNPAQSNLNQPPSQLQSFLRNQAPGIELNSTVNTHVIQSSDSQISNIQPILSTVTNNNINEKSISTSQAKSQQYKSNTPLFAPVALKDSSVQRPRLLIIKHQGIPPRLPRAPGSVSGQRLLILHGSTNSPINSNSLSTIKRSAIPTLPQNFLPRVTSHNSTEITNHPT